MRDYMQPKQMGEGHGRKIRRIANTGQCHCYPKGDILCQEFKGDQRATTEKRQAHGCVSEWDTAEEFSATQSRCGHKQIKRKYKIWNTSTRCATLPRASPKDTRSFFPFSFCFVLCEHSLNKHIMFSRLSGDKEWTHGDSDTDPSAWTVHKQQQTLLLTTARWGASKPKSHRREKEEGWERVVRLLFVVWLWWSGTRSCKWECSGVSDEV